MLFFILLNIFLTNNQRKKKEIVKPCHPLCRDDFGNFPYQMEHLGIWGLDFWYPFLHPFHCSIQKLQFI